MLLLAMLLMRAEVGTNPYCSRVCWNSGDEQLLEGGAFVTYTKGELVEHEMQPGDAILFRSEKCHNVTTVRRGKRHSLVTELWVQPPNSFDRFS
jgi:predicted 2-oxoglutarate/Fe(II)-dependent dioxygenase YbiX